MDILYLIDKVESLIATGLSLPVMGKVIVDREQLLEFVSKSKDSLEKVFAIQGEPASCLFLVQRVRDYLGIPAYAPKYGETYQI